MQREGFTAVRLLKRKQRKRVVQLHWFAELVRPVDLWGRRPQEEHGEQYRTWRKNDRMGWSAHFLAHLCDGDEVVHQRAEMTGASSRNEQDRLDVIEESEREREESYHEAGT